MKPIPKLIRMANIGKAATQKLADEALAEYTQLTTTLKAKMDEIEERNDDGWEAWIELKEWLISLDKPA